MSELAITEQNRTALPVHTPTVTTPATLLAMAVQQNADLTKLEKLMELQERWEANEARKAFVAAKAAFKNDAPKIVKDKENKQYKSMYATLANLVNTAMPELGKHGLEASWEIDQSEGITVTCVLTHVLGHQERVSMSGQPDTSGAKNSLQQIKSTVTYLKGETFTSVTGLAAVDAADDDGNSAGADTISEKQIADLEALMEEVKADRVLFLRHLKLTRLEDMHVSAYDNAVAELRRKGKRNAAGK